MYIVVAITKSSFSTVLIILSMSIGLNVPELDCASSFCGASGGFEELSGLLDSSSEIDVISTSFSSSVMLSSSTGGFRRLAGYSIPPVDWRSLYKYKKLV